MSMGIENGNNNELQATMKFEAVRERALSPREIILRVHDALAAKGYNPINQIVGYIMSGDPSYITSYDNARSLIRKLETDEILEELVKYYVEEK